MLSPNQINHQWNHHGEHRAHRRNGRHDGTGELASNLLDFLSQSLFGNLDALREPRLHVVDLLRETSLHLVDSLVQSLFDAVAILLGAFGHGGSVLFGPLCQSVSFFSRPFGQSISFFFRLLGQGATFLRGPVEPIRQFLDVTPSGHLLVGLPEQIDDGVGLLVGKSSLLAQSTERLAGVDERGHNKEALNQQNTVGTSPEEEVSGKQISRKKSIHRFSEIDMTQELAGRGTRLGAILLDNLFALLALVPGGVAFVGAADSYGNDGMGAALFLLVAGLLGFLGIQIYLLVQNGQTIGKRTVGIRIVDYNDGTLLGAGRILGMRGVLPGVIASIPYVGWIFALADALFIFGEERRCIHDYMAQSKVVVGSAADVTPPTIPGPSHAGGKEASAPSMSPPAAAPAARGGEERHTDDVPEAPRSDSSPAVPPSIDRLRQVLRNLEELCNDGILTEKKFRQSRRKALADFVEATEADPEAILRGLRQLRDEGHLEAADVQTVKSIL